MSPRPRRSATGNAIFICGMFDLDFIAFFLCLFTDFDIFFS